MIHTKGLYITDPGDMSVGIFPQMWKLEGDMIFDDEETFTQFKEDLRTAFELVTDGGVCIETFEQEEETQKQLDKLDREL